VSLLILLVFALPDPVVINSVELNGISEAIRKSYQTMLEARIVAIPRCCLCIVVPLQYLGKEPQA